MLGVAHQLPAGDRLAPARAEGDAAMRCCLPLLLAACPLPAVAAGSERVARTDRAARRARGAAQPLRHAAQPDGSARADRRVPDPAHAAAALPRRRAQQAARRHLPQGRQFADPLRPAGDRDAAGHLDAAASSRARATARAGRSASASSSARPFPRWTATAPACAARAAEGRYASTLAYAVEQRQAEEPGVALEGGAGGPYLRGRASSTQQAVQRRPALCRGPLQRDAARPGRVRARRRRGLRGACAARRATSSRCWWTAGAPASCCGRIRGSRRWPGKSSSASRRTRSC